MKRIICLTILSIFPALAAADPVKVVTTLPTYASIAQFVGGDLVEAYAISRGDEDAHFVKPKPSFALMLKDADLFVTTGVDLELWAPTLVDKSGNRKIRDGAPGFVSASQGVPMLEIPENVSREGGDIHIYGNPHIHTSPLNAKIIAANIAAGLKRVDPESASAYDTRLREFQHRIDVSLFGPDLVELLGAETLDNLARSGKLHDFLESQTFEGTKLHDMLGVWFDTDKGLRGKKIVAYHKNWIYFAELFGLEIVDYVERKPGIPPSARHVHELMAKIEADDVKVILAANYFGRSKIDTIAERTGCAAVSVPLGSMETSAESYFDLVTMWVESLSRVLSDEN